MMPKARKGNPGIDPGGPKAKYCRKRLISPKKCAPSSFRVKGVKGKPGTKLTICCSVGFYDRKKKQCKIGTIVQSIMKKKVKGKCPVF